MRIEALKIQNYRALRAVSLENLTGLSVFVGANGSGKSTLFDVFGFLHDALVHNVRQALAKRGGFREVVSRGQEGPIKIELKFRQEDEPLVTYSLEISLEGGQPVVQREVLKYPTIHRAADDPQLVALAQEGDLPGSLWKQGLFTGAHPQ